ncbi:hypothetical protein BVI434_1010010 [Burkholderia vietnamiensis]|nr:hypothetical protein BVI434_1010010 [Burkholderia vietnamiensis]
MNGTDMAKGSESSVNWTRRRDTAGRGRRVGKRQYKCV